MHKPRRTSPALHRLCFPPQLQLSRSPRFAKEVLALWRRAEPALPHPLGHPRGFPVGCSGQRCFQPELEVLCSPPLASSTQSLMLVPVSCILSLNQSCHLAWVFCCFFFYFILFSGSKKQILIRFPRRTHTLCTDFSQPHAAQPCPGSPGVTGCQLPKARRRGDEGSYLPLLPQGHSKQIPTWQHNVPEAF